MVLANDVLLNMPHQWIPAFAGMKRRVHASNASSKTTLSKQPMAPSEAEGRVQVNQT
jgi:hypothetical protein